MGYSTVNYKIHTGDKIKIGKINSHGQIGSAWKLTVNRNYKILLNTQQKIRIRWKILIIHKLLKKRLRNISASTQPRNPRFESRLRPATIEALRSGRLSTWVMRKPKTIFKKWLRCRNLSSSHEAVQYFL